MDRPLPNITGESDLQVVLSESLEDLDTSIMSLMEMMDLGTTMADTATTLMHLSEVGIGNDTLQQYPSVHRWINNMVANGDIDGYDSIPDTSYADSHFTILTLEAASNNLDKKGVKLSELISGRISKMKAKIGKAINPVRYITPEVIREYKAALADMPDNPNGEIMDISIMKGSVEKCMTVDKAMAKSYDRSKALIIDILSKKMNYVKTYKLGSDSDKVKELRLIDKEVTGRSIALSHGIYRTAKQCGSSRVPLSRYNKSMCVNLIKILEDAPGQVKKYSDTANSYLDEWLKEYNRMVVASAIPFVSIVSIARFATIARTNTVFGRVSSNLCACSAIQNTVKYATKILDARLKV